MDKSKSEQKFPEFLDAQNTLKPKLNQKNEDSIMSTIKEEKSLYNPQERKQSHHLELLNKLTAESHMSSKQKKSPEEIVKARLNSLLKNPGLFLKRAECKELNPKSVISKEETTGYINNNNYIQNCTSEMKPNAISKSPSPQIKTEPKEQKQPIVNLNEANRRIELNQNTLIKKINEIKFNKFIMNKSINMSQNISPKFIAQNSLQKSSNLVNQSNQSNNESTQNQSALNTFNKFNKTFLNVGLIKNRKKNEITKNNSQNIAFLNKDHKFINLKKGKYKDFNHVINSTEKPNSAFLLHSQTNENISVNTSHNISLNSNQIHILNENRFSQKVENDNECSILEKKIEGVLENNEENKNKFIEVFENLFDFLKNRHKNYENLLMKGKLALTRLYEDYVNKCEKEVTFKELIERLSCENEKLQKDSHEIENNLKKNKKEMKNENIMNSSSTNYTNTIHKNPKMPNSNISKENNNDFKILTKENQKLKNVILDQQNSLYQMKEKESKLIKLLQGVKKRGIDLDEIFREEVIGDNQDKSDKGNESDIGNLHLVDDRKEKYVTEKSFKFKNQKSSTENSRVENEEDIEKNKADESLINDSDESSFNYFGKPESVPTSIEVEIQRQPKKRTVGVKSNTTHFNSKLKDKLKLNLSQIQRKNLVQSSSDNNQDNKNKNLEKMAKIFQKKMSEQTHHHYKLKKDEHEEMLKNIEEMGEIWKKMKK